MRIDSSGNSYFRGAGHTNLEVRSASTSTKAFIQTVQDSDIRIGSNTNHPVAFYSNSVERMRVTTAGNIGIGTTSPQSLLHVQATNNSAGDLYTQVGVGNCPSISIGNVGTTDNNNAALFFRNDGGERASIGARFVSHSTEETELRFSTTNSSGASRERMTLKGSGALQINNCLLYTSPSPRDRG